METASIAALEHVAAFLPSDSRAALACSRRLRQAAALAHGSSGSSSSMDRWRFLACFEESAARPLRWGCWLPDAQSERRLLHAALRGYQAFLRRPTMAGFAAARPDDGTEPPLPTIPRIVHQIWLGSPLPERFEAWRASYREHHPGKTRQ